MKDWSNLVRNPHGFSSDKFHTERRAKEFSAWVADNFGSIMSHVPANQQAGMRDILKGAFYSGYNSMYADTD